MKRYLIFAYKHRFIPPGPSHNSKVGYWETAHGGWSDFIGDFEELADFKIFSNDIKSKFDACHIVDTTFPSYAIIPFKGGIYHNYKIQECSHLYEDFMNRHLNTETIFHR